MIPSRIFLSQESLEAWLGDGRAQVEADVLTDQETKRRFELREGVRFIAEVSSGEDGHGLVGRVKDLEQLAELGGEHMADSVILGESAYQVQAGFVGRYIPDEAEAAASEAPSVPPSRPPAGDQNQRKTIVALQQFFLNNVK